MNLKNFSLLSEDDKHYTIGHPKGKSIKVEKAGLSPKAHETIKMLADGTPDGTVEDTSTDRAPASSFWENSDARAKAALEAAPAAIESGSEKLGQGLKNVWNWIATPSQTASAIPPSLTGQQSLIPSSGGQTTVTPSAETAPASTGSSNPVIPQAPQPASAPPMQIGGPGLGSILSEGQKGIEQTTAAKQQAATAQSNIEQQKSNALNNWQAHFNDVSQLYENEGQHLAQDVKDAKINPNDLYENASVPGKIASAVGLILGGIGGGLTHQGNPALAYLNSQIDRDMQAQKDNLGKKENLLSAHYNMTKNMQSAQLLTRAGILDNYSNQLSSALAKAQGTAAGGEGMQQVANWQLQARNMRQQAAVFDSLNHVSGGDPAMKVGLMGRVGIIPQETQNNALKEIGAHENHIANKKLLLDSMDKVAQLNTPENRLMNPIQSQAQIDAIWNPMIDKFVKDNAGRVTPISIDMINAFKSGLTHDKHTKNMQKLAASQYMDASGVSTPTLDSIGIKLPKMGATPQLSPQRNK